VMTILISVETISRRSRKPPPSWIEDLLHRRP